MKFYGTRATYRIFAIGTLISGLLYFAFNWFYLSKLPEREGNDIVKKEPKIKDTEALQISTIEFGIGKDKIAQTLYNNGEDASEKNADVTEKIGEINCNNEREEKELTKDEKIDDSKLKEDYKHVEDEDESNVRHRIRQVNGVDNKAFEKDETDESQYQHVHANTQNDKL